LTSGRGRKLGRCIRSSHQKGKLKPPLARDLARHKPAGRVNKQEHAIVAMRLINADYEELLV
jgi:hypothetical protein